MKKLFALLLAAVMVLSLAACSGGGELSKAAKEIEKITGKATTVDDIKEAMEQLEAMSGKKVTAQDVVDFTREMYGLMEDDPDNDGDDGDKDTPDSDEWPLADVPAWPVTEDLFWGTRGGNMEISVKGSESDLQTWAQNLKQAGFAGYVGNYDSGFLSSKYRLWVDNNNAGDGYVIEVRIPEDEVIFGLPDELKGLFPEYVGEGTLIYGWDEDYDGMKAYYFDVYGETEEHCRDYIAALEAAGFVNQYPDSTYTGGGGYFFKEVDGKKLGYQVEEYWYDTGYAEIVLTVE